MDLGKQRRFQFVECPNDINAMVDCAKVADLALLVVDGSYGFEMVRHYFSVAFSSFHNDLDCEESFLCIQDHCWAFFVIYIFL